MTDIIIPPEAVEAGARAAYEDNKNRSKSSVAYPDWQNLECSVRETYCSEARAAILAALKAWPGAAERRSWDGSIGRLILPLTTQEPGDEAQD